MNTPSIKPKGKAPAVMFYTGDFLSSPDVQAMDGNEVGCYCLLLFNAWQGDKPGYLPNDEGRLRRLGRMNAEQWAESRNLILSKFPVAEDATLRFNPRMVLEASRQAEYREQKAEAGRASAAKRASSQPNINAKATGVEIKATGVEKSANDIGNGNSTFHLHISSSITEEQDTLGGVGEFGRVATAPLTPSAAITLEGKEVEACKSIPELEATWHRYPTRHAETGFKNLVNAKKKELLAEAAKDVAKPKNAAKHITDLVTDPELNFDAFWKAYGHTKGNKEKANRSWVLLPVDVRRHIIRGLPQFIGSLRDRQYQPHATTFFSGKLWANESYTVPDSPIAPLKTIHRVIGGVAPTETYLPDYQQKFRDQSAKQYR